MSNATLDFGVLRRAECLVVSCFDAGHLQPLHLGEVSGHFDSHETLYTLLAELDVDVDPIIEWVVSRFPWSGYDGAKRKGEQLTEYEMSSLSELSKYTAAFAGALLAHAFDITATKDIVDGVSLDVYQYMRLKMAARLA